MIIAGKEISNDYFGETFSSRGSAASVAYYGFVYCLELRAHTVHRGLWSI